MNLPILGDVIREVGNIIDDVVTTDEEVLKLQLQQRALEAALQQSQIASNIEALKHPSVFVAGARPAVMWICATALAWNYVMYPCFSFIVWLFPEYRDVVDTAPKLDMSELMTLLTGMLGFGAYRSFDKLKKIDTKRVE